MKILIPILLSFLASFGTLIGSLLVFVPNIGKKSTISLILAFSGTVMILISVLDLLPPSIITIFSKFNVLNASFITIASFLSGYLIINMLDKKMEGEKSILKLGILSLIALMVHNFPEGIVTFLSGVTNLKIGLKLSFAIMFHNIPEGICIALPIYIGTKSFKKAFSSTFLSCLAEPLGALLAYVFLYRYISDIMIAIILIFTAGIMITLSINSIYKESLKFNKKAYFIYGVLLSLIYIVISLIIGI